MIFNPRPKTLGLGAKAYVSLKDGEEITGVFRGNPYTYYRHWTGTNGVECTRKLMGTCDLCETSEKKAAYRFKMNFITSVDGKYVAKVFEGGGDLYDELANLHKKFNLAVNPVEITRRGTGTSTRYTILPLVNAPLTNEMQMQIEAVPLLKLTANEV